MTGTHPAAAPDEPGRGLRQNAAQFSLLVAGLPVAQVGLLAALYPAVWGLGQLFTGALSDRWGRKHLITAGMLLQALALALVALADTFAIWAVAAITAGSGVVVAARMYETHSFSR